MALEAVPAEVPPMASQEPEASPAQIAAALVIEWRLGMLKASAGFALQGSCPPDLEASRPLAGLELQRRQAEGSPT